MRYLIPFNESVSETECQNRLKDIYNEHMDWKLFRYLQDVTLEYVDRGLDVNIEACINGPNDISKVTSYIIYAYAVKLDENLSHEYWCKGFNEERYFDWIAQSFKNNGGCITYMLIINYMKPGFKTEDELGKFQQRCPKYDVTFDKGWLRFKKKNIV